MIAIDDQYLGHFTSTLKSRVNEQYVLYGAAITTSSSVSQAPILL